MIPNLPLGNLLGMPDEKAILAAFQKFADTVKAKMSTLTSGEREDRLRSPFEVLMKEIVPTGETLLAGRVGKIEKQLKHSTTVQALFTIRWTIR